MLAALGHPLRRAVVHELASDGERSCRTLVEGVPPSTLTHHWRVLRESGVTLQRRVGRELLVSLRRDDLDARFPGLLDAILESDPERLRA